MNPGQSPNTGPGGKDFGGNKEGEKQILRADKILILSGEGERGYFEEYTGKRSMYAINRRLKKEESGGDRWVKLLVQKEGDTYFEINPDTLEIVNQREVPASEILRKNKINPMLSYYSYPTKQESCSN